MINVVFKGAQGFHFLKIGKNRVIIVFTMQARSAGLCPFNYSLLYGNTKASSIIEKPSAHSLYSVKISVRFRHMERKWSEENLRWKTKTILVLLQISVWLWRSKENGSPLSYCITSLLDPFYRFRAMRSRMIIIQLTSTVLIPPPSPLRQSVGPRIILLWAPFDWLPIVSPLSFYSLFFIILFYKSFSFEYLLWNDWPIKPILASDIGVEEVTRHSLVEPRRFQDRYK